MSNSVDKLNPVDAADFLVAVNNSLVFHDAGFFRAPCSATAEQIIWQTGTKSPPFKMTLWLEPIITIAGLARLHRDFGWPLEQLGMQSKSWAFDLAAYSLDKSTESIACEVKKTCREIEKLLSFMLKHSLTPNDAFSNLTVSAEKNAFKKLMGLRESKAPVFWALGPGNQGKVFEVHYGTNEGHLEKLARRLIPA